jgi:hypothetical protein
MFLYLTVKITMMADIMYMIRMIIIETARDTYKELVLPILAIAN